MLIFGFDLFFIPMSPQGLFQECIKRKKNKHTGLFISLSLTRYCFCGPVDG